MLEFVMLERLVLLVALGLLPQAGSLSPPGAPGVPPLVPGSATHAVFVNTSGLVEVGQGGEAVMECVTRNLANNNLVRSKWWSEVV